MPSEREKREHKYLAVLSSTLLGLSILSFIIFGMWSGFILICCGGWFVMAIYGIAWLLEFSFSTNWEK
jgi:hypothetical protein